MAISFKGNDPIGRHPIFHFDDYMVGRVKEEQCFTIEG